MVSKYFMATFQIYWGCPTVLPLPQLSPRKPLQTGEFFTGHINSLLFNKQIFMQTSFIAPENLPISVRHFMVMFLKSGTLKN